MDNFIQKGKTLTVTAPATVLSGAMVKVGQIHGVAVKDAASGAAVEVLTVGVFTLPKKSTDAIAAGDLLYWDNTNAYLTKTSATGLTLVGVATEAAIASTTTVSAKLDGTVRAAAA
jgi:predicted RecA/RadA family phage recombinase